MSLELVILAILNRARISYFILLKCILRPYQFFQYIHHTSQCGNKANSTGDFYDERANTERFIVKLKITSKTFTIIVPALYLHNNYILFFLGFNLRFISRSKSDSMCCCLLYLSYSVSAFSSACFREILP